MGWKVIGKIGGSETGRSILKSNLIDYLNVNSTLWSDISNHAVVDYPEVGRDDERAHARLRTDPIIITARFRSGSTLLWNLFRNIPGCTSYFEPLHEQRPFHLCEFSRAVDPSHVGVTDYWAEYRGVAELAQCFRDHWHGHNYLMGPDHWEPELQRYVETMIEHAKGRPILQFNRIDFRLPWFRKHFPNATIVHLYRHPRDQWCSTIVDHTNAAPHSGRVTPEMTVEEFAHHDYHDLLLWAKDLKFHFPFLDESRVKHPYQLFYFIWKLSFLFGKRYADYSFKFEDLVQKPESQLKSLMAATRLEGYDLAHLKSLMVMPALGKWKHFASDAWFREHEEYCETILGDFLGRETTRKQHDGQANRAVSFTHLWGSQSNGADGHQPIPQRVLSNP